MEAHQHGQNSWYSLRVKQDYEVSTPDECAEATPEYNLANKMASNTNTSDRKMKRTRFPECFGIDYQLALEYAIHRPRYERVRCTDDGSIICGGAKHRK